MGNYSKEGGVLLFSPTAENWTRWPVNPNSGQDLFFFETFDEEYWYQFQMAYWWVFWIITGAYWVICYSLQRLMRDREPLGVSEAMTVYNILVGAFSIFALWRVSSTFFGVLLSQGFYSSICVRFSVTEKEGFWLLAVAWSKLAHFMDSVFTALRKKPLQFMQLYHHSVVVLIPQHILPYGEPILIWWGVINLIQHCLTYPYFALRSMKVKVPKFAAALIVLVEVLQMLMGLGTGLYTLHVLNSGGYCVRHPRSISIMYFVYATMTILSFHLAYTHFTKRESTASVKPKAKTS